MTQHRHTTACVRSYGADTYYSSICHDALQGTYKERKDSLERADQVSGEPPTVTVTGTGGTAHAPHGRYD
jgi:hypothetical protein